MKKAAKFTYIIHWVLMGLILAISIVGAIINKDTSVKSIYIFNAMQAFMFLVVSFTPTILKRLHFEIPDIVYIVFVIFMSAHFFCGEICGFFAKISWWDSLLHSFSGFILTFISYSVISLMNETKNNNFKLNIYFSVLFAFALTVTIGVLWEIVEFASDAILGTNMQRAYESVADGGSRGEALVGSAALLDTMKDLILDSIGSLCACALCVLLHKTKKVDMHNFSVIKRKKTNLKTEKDCLEEAESLSSNEEKISKDSNKKTEVESEEIKTNVEKSEEKSKVNKTKTKNKSTKNKTKKVKDNNK